MPFFPAKWRNIPARIKRRALHQTQYSRLKVKWSFENDRKSSTVSSDTKFIPRGTFMDIIWRKVTKRKQKHARNFVIDLQDFI